MRYTVTQQKRVCREVMHGFNQLEQKFLRNKFDDGRVELDRVRSKYQHPERLSEEDMARALHKRFALALTKAFGEACAERDGEIAFYLQLQENCARRLRKQKAECRAVFNRVDDYDPYRQGIIPGIRMGQYGDKDITARFARKNLLKVGTYTVWQQYTKSQSYPRNYHTFLLTLKRGWRMRVVGGLLTWYKGDFNRECMPVEWTKQGRAIADVTMHKGWLIRGMHIEVKSQEEAVRISQERRSKALQSILRHRAATQHNAVMERKLKATFDDSISSGNCHHGTAQFKARYEAAIGHEATEISLADLRKYGKMFGVENYAERVIRYVKAKQA